MTLLGTIVQSILVAIFPPAFDRKKLLHALRRIYKSPVLFRGSYGIFYLLRGTNYIDARIMRHGIYEPASVRALLEQVRQRKADMFLDVGANIGVYSLAVAKQGVCPRICAFEPDPHNKAQLFANLFLNGWEERVQVFGDAVSDTDGTARMFAFRDPLHPSTGRSSLEGHESSASIKSIPVRKIRLDDVFADVAGRSIVVKMDIEGHEAKALAGMKKLLSNNRIWLQVELLPLYADEIRAELRVCGLVEQPQSVPGTSDFIFASG